MKKHHAAVAATALSLALALTACSNDDGTGPSASGSQSEVTVSHIHGLGLDPSGRRLYVATHEGVYTPDGKGGPKLVGDSKDDFMGFTVARDGTFYASGHPVSGGDKGLIRSTDAGETWTTLSLAGQSDFHALEHAHDTVYGYDASHGLLRTSKDGTVWKDGARLQAVDIAVSPENPDVVLATTPEGVSRSTDKGRTFSKGTQPVMAFLSWKAEDALYGIDPSGRLSRSADGGATWKTLSTVPGGRPQALTAVDAERVLAATQDGVYESVDGGRTFTKRLTVVSSDGH